MTTIHSTALVHAGAEIGDNVTVGPYAIIGDKVQIAAGTIIGPYVTIYPFTTIGAECFIHAHVVLGDWPQDMAFKPEDTSYLKIGSGCRIREGVTIHRGTKPGSMTEVGDHCFLMANSHVAHNVKLGNYVVLVNGALLGGYVEVEDRAFISGNCLVHQFCRIGKLAILSGGTAYNKDVPPFCKTGSISNTVIGLNMVGLRRAGISLEDRQAIRQAFNILYRSGLNVSQAVKRLKEACPSGPAQEICVFIESSKRGICHGPSIAEEKSMTANE